MAPVYKLTFYNGVKNVIKPRRFKILFMKIEKRRMMFVKKDWIIDNILTFFFFNDCKFYANIILHKQFKNIRPWLFKRWIFQIFNITFHIIDD